ncbi:MAG: PIN domain-containing protein [Deltaproteobacteria bacterium]|nr:PIN domain-containing protein [Deltaproteobacteria bacterium]
MFVVDTNVLLYAVNQECAEHRRCHALVERSRRQQLPWFLTWGVVYEFLRVITHPSAVRRPWSAARAWAFVEALLTSPGIGVLTATRRHAAVAKQTISEVPGLAGNLLHDAHTAILMREHGIRSIYTRDSDFERFPFVEVLDPLVNT